MEKKSGRPSGRSEYALRRDLEHYTHQRDRTDAQIAELTEKINKLVAKAEEYNLKIDGLQEELDSRSVIEDNNESAAA